MPVLMLLEALGGLGLFILGMKIMSLGLQRLAGQRVRRTLETVASNRFSSVLMGTILTTLLQSGGAASIIAVGLVNAGLLSLYQSLPMLIGTGAGTTLVVQLLAFKISFAAAPGIFIGALLKFFSRRRKSVYLGEVILGLSLLFFGLHIMEANFSPLKESTVFASYQSYLPSWHIVQVLLGALLAFLVQSGSVAIGIIVTLAVGGLLQPEHAVAMVIGEALGTTCLAAIGTISGTIAAKRTVFIYFIMTSLLLLLVLLLFPLFLKLVFLVSPHQGAAGNLLSVENLRLPAASLSRFIVNAHTVFSMLSILLFLPLVGFFTRSAAKILPVRATGMDLEPRLQFIDFRVTNTPVIGFMQAKNEIQRMAELTSSMFTDMAAMFDGYDAKISAVIREKENCLDALLKDISAFMVALARQPLPAEISAGIPVMLQTANCLEGIGDECERILECLRRKKEEHVYFSIAAMVEIRKMATIVSDLLQLVMQSVESENSFEPADSIYKNIKIVKEELNQKHISRLSSGGCSVIAGLLYLDIITAFARIADLSFEIINNQRSTR